ncbi:MAG: hypothetical protein C0483_17105 [Pirellula sp.]|nr:hypothetical protein [Pirellula sp.]
MGNPTARSKTMNSIPVVGTKPRLFGSLAGSAWWTKPIRAERMAAFRIGMGLALLVDIFCFYLPSVHDFFGGNSLGSPEIFAGRLADFGRWSLLGGISDVERMRAALSVWAAAALLLTLGVYPRVCAAIAWMLAVSVQNANFYLHNSGDNVRNIGLFYLMLAPCGAAWTLDGLRRRLRSGPARPVLIYPWPVRLLTVQLATIYFMNGAYKFAGGDWRNGQVMHDVLGHIGWTRFPTDALPIPEAAIVAMTWTTLCWELGFPLLMLIPRLRLPTLLIGVSFHLGTMALFQIAMFPIYMLCLYLPLAPWEACDRRLDGAVR